jgi:hypothetical protein
VPTLGSAGNVGTSGVVPLARQSPTMEVLAGLLDMWLWRLSEADPGHSDWAFDAVIVAVRCSLAAKSNVAVIPRLWPGAGSHGGQVSALQDARNRLGSPVAHLPCSYPTNRRSIDCFSILDPTPSDRAKSPERRQDRQPGVTPPLDMPTSSLLATIPSSPNSSHAGAGLGNPVTGRLALPVVLGH